MTTGTNQPVIRYENNGTTPEERKTICKKNLAKFGQDARAGKVLCLTDLIGQAEQVHIDNLSK